MTEAEDDKDAGTLVGAALLARAEETTPTDDGATLKVDTTDETLEAGGRVAEDEGGN